MNGKKEFIRNIFKNMIGMYLILVFVNAIITSWRYGWSIKRVDILVDTINVLINPLVCVLIYNLLGKNRMTYETHIIESSKENIEKLENFLLKKAKKLNESENISIYKIKNKFSFFPLKCCIEKSKDEIIINVPKAIWNDINKKSNFNSKSYET